MILASSLITLHFPEAHSLKDKRRLLQGLIRKLRERHNVSVVELDGRDLWQRAVLGVALAARERLEAETRMERLRRDVEEITGLKYIDFEAQYHS